MGSMFQKVLQFLLLRKSVRLSEKHSPNEKELVVKSQILAGVRGLGKFKSGLQGGVHIVKAEQVEEIAGKMLGQTLVTKQTGPQGKVVIKVRDA